MIFLGIETSCDETAVAILDRDGNILAERVRAQWTEHAPYGGVVPEIAARAHLECLDGLVAESLAMAGLEPANIDAVAATAGPGLIGGLVVGMTTAKALALALRKPFYAINHLEAHILTATLTNAVKPPYLTLLVSGGHCQLVWVSCPGTYQVLGQTLDDSVGEAFDKTARLLGLPWPGGPALEILARSGQGDAIRLPRPMVGKKNCDFSFAGLKTAVRRIVETGLDERGRADLAASFQAAAIDVLVDRSKAAFAVLRRDNLVSNHLVAAGGVAANRSLCIALEELARCQGQILAVPPPVYCTDNAVMIAWAALERVRVGQAGPEGDGLETPPKPRWSL